MKVKKLALCLAVIAATGFCASYSDMSSVQAATRTEIRAIAVSKDGDFKYWNTHSIAKDKLISYVQDVINQKIKIYFPVPYRVAVFDMDGTLIGEKAPSYTDGVFYADRVLHDPNCHVSSEDKAFAQAYWNAISSSKPLPDHIYHNLYEKLYAGLSGMTLQEFDAYADTFFNKPVMGFSNMKYGEAFFLPMVEVISYLNANDFTCYIISAADRPLVRNMVKDVIPITPDHIIGSDSYIVSSHQGETPGESYDLSYTDTIQYGKMDRIQEKMNKVSSIIKEIGQQPVLAFGNSSGDYSMFRYTLLNNPHKSAVFNVLCDDTEREYGNLDKAEKARTTSEKNGWNTISMKHDWNTIYGDNVQKVRK